MEESYQSAAGAPIVVCSTMASLWVTACLSVAMTLVAVGVTVAWLQRRGGCKASPPPAGDHYCALDDLDL